MIEKLKFEIDICEKNGNGELIKRSFESNRTMIKSYNI